ncbi:TonB-dependent siderophore receptor [Consotaella salsifontis]|uniref:Iron complex outermembrane recepter protein n=1 Tax=Consotaella salsifontis TaxID=1365950 RepID=A0A1T4LVA8_9HYPH|nr:TonB-dependent siderophore receptor [Consotaella salsifontis]SJZ58561.1 iron complex outermembrane recepter protein [Consotaella salsifontis]
METTQRHGWISESNPRQESLFIAARAPLALLLCSTAIALPSSALAQSAPDQGETTTLQTIVIEGQGGDTTGSNDTVVAKRSATGSKTDTPILDQPASVSVITEDELERRNVQDVQQAVSYTSSVSVDQYGSDDRYDFFQIRGFDQTSLGTYRDGLPIPILGWTASRLEPYGLQRLEVLKGSTSTLFGLNGPGGLINAITKLPQDQAFGEVYTTFGGAHAEVGTDFGGPIGTSGEWSYRFTAIGQDASRSGDYSNDDRIYVAPAVTYSPDAATTFTLLADYNKRDGNTAYGFPAGVDIDPDTFLGEPSFNAFDTEEYNVGYLFDHKFDNGLSIRSNARYTHIDLDYRQVYGAQIDPTIDRTSFFVDGEVERFAIDNQLQYDASWNRIDSKTLVGVDYVHDTLGELALVGTADGIDIYNPVYCGRGCITLDPYLNHDIIQKRTGIYAQEELTLDDRWILTLGGRWDNVETEQKDRDTGARDENTDTAFTKRAGLTYKITDGLAVYGNYSESFQPLITSGQTFEPQEGTQYEVGVKYEPEQINALFTLALFDLKQTNVPSYVTPTTQRQIGEVRVRGVELEGKMALDDRMNLIAAYTYWDAEIEEDGLTGNAGNRPSNVPEHLASLWLDYTLPGDGARGDLTLGAGVRYVGSVYGDDANTVDVGSHTVFDAAINYEVAENVDLAVHATNLFDEKYVSTVYYGTAYYGDGRQILGTLKYSW